MPCCSITPTGSSNPKWEEFSVTLFESFCQHKHFCLCFKVFTWSSRVDLRQAWGCMEWAESSIVPAGAHELASGSTPGELNPGLYLSIFLVITTLCQKLCAVWHEGKECYYDHTSLRRASEQGAISSRTQPPVMPSQELQKPMDETSC